MKLFFMYMAWSLSLSATGEGSQEALCLAEEPLAANVTAEVGVTFSGVASGKLPLLQ